VPTIEAQSRNKLKQGPRSTHPARFVPGIGRSPLSSQRVVTVGKLRSSPTHSCQKYENRMVSSLQYTFSLLLRCPGRVHTILHASITHTLYTEGSVDRGSVQSTDHIQQWSRHTVSHLKIGFQRLCSTTFVSPALSLRLRLSTSVKDAIRPGPRKRGVLYRLQNNQHNTICFCQQIICDLSFPTHFPGWRPAYPWNEMRL